MAKLVTKTSLVAMLDNPNRAYVEAVVGRALVGIFNQQTADEQISNQTRKFNNIGFTGADAHSGSITAKYFIKHRKLLDWQIERWLKKNRKGTPRIAKYWSQLNNIANKKVAV